MPIATSLSPLARKCINKCLTRLRHLSVNIVRNHRYLHTSSASRNEHSDGEVDPAYSISYHEDHPHNPVMAREVVQYLDLSPRSTIIDMTFGAGGHSKKILETVPDVKIFALDRDPVAHEYAHKLASEYPNQVIPLLGRFSELPQLLKEQRILANHFDAFLFDFGCSSMQFDIGSRGFSISKDGPLDMRMDGFRCPEQLTAEEILERMDETDLTRVLKVYGEEKRARKIAQAIVETRFSFRKLKTTHELAQLVGSVLGGSHTLNKMGKHAHVATRTFQALRIFVNNELNEINYGIQLAQVYLKTKGRLLTLSFHSLEDTIVKKHLVGNINDSVDNRLLLKYSNCDKTYDISEFEELTASPWIMLHKHVITPTEDEVELNPRSRSAKLRALEKIA